MKLRALFTINVVVAGVFGISFVEEACKDKKLQKWIQNWEAWHSNVMIFNKKLKQEYQATLILLLGREL